ncbi:hypothetical protein RchiOBHm_Chr5g0033881 [Rosa chinensis]|uniref:RING-type E3 ubiquitin transferase n=1 Tax=Rosa chinensis TaxID=74649 RepID=A0A2P6QAT5_ROSCH|nr:uncharacterized protein LOC112203564 [Rosa chinensis]PRQ31292.1 hypothetical protein RchiOBHm_Chr5g0033881 [Rosa chinensis]
MTIFRKPKLVIFFFCVFTTFSLNSISSFALPKKIAYADNCASVVPESTLKADSRDHRHEYLHTGYYYTGGDTGNGDLSDPYGYYYQLQNSVEFHVWSFEETAVQGLFKLRANLQFPKTRTYYYVGNSTSSSSSRSRSIHAHPRWSLNFRLHGFWSESSGKLCMVGYGSYSKKGTSLSYPAILKLYNLINSSSITSLITGTIESLIPSSDIVKDPRYFDPTSILMLPRMNYQYTLVSTNSIEDTSFGDTDDHDPSSSLKLENFCSQLSTVVLKNEFDLKYSSKCVSARNCTPLAGVDPLPRLVSFKDIDCRERNRRLRVLVEFADSSNMWFQRPFNPNTTLVAEGSWDAKKNQLEFVACHFLEAATDSFNNSHVGDCSTRLSLRFPATWTIGNTSTVVGHIWSNKSKTESGYFEKIRFETCQREAGRVVVPGTKYEYTKLDQVNKLCSRKKTAANGHKTNVYPSPISYEMRFRMSARRSKGYLDAWGSSEPVSVGDKIYEELPSSTQYSGSAAIDEDENYSLGIISSYNNSNPSNISYRISIQLLGRSAGKLGNTTHMTEMHISAEGIYDTEGSLCMVGCRNVGLNSDHQTTEDSVDCEILVNFQFPPDNQHSENKGYIKVRIESTRKESDPLHFERLDLSSVAGYMSEAERSIWRMDMEIILVLVSTTLACVFVALQQFHVKKHPDVLPSISILMLLILTVGYMIPLMLNFDAMFTDKTNRQYVPLGSGGWLAVHEVIVRVITMVAFLLQFRLLQQTWSARSANGKQKELWDVEKKVLPLYPIGYLVAWAVIPISMDLKSYAGLVLDGYLLPQILLNVVCKSKERALSVSFYIGTTLVRVLPHAYDLYRTHSSVHQQLDESYIYASPAGDFYSTSWDVIIPIGGLLFSLIIFLQQKFGGRCFLPQKLRELGSYEKVPSVIEAELPT